MGRNNWFEFKKFKIIQEQAAMKVNTDGVLLGAWTNFNNAQTILDVGTGTGLIALMAAQRSEAEITGIEIEKNAADEATENVKHSQWSSRITVKNISFQQFSETHNTRFDLLVSNPPFFSNGVKNNDPHLSMARHNHLLPFSELISGAKKLLGTEGILALILPNDEASGFIEKAEDEGFILNRLTKVIPYPGKEPNRYLMEFGFVKRGLVTNVISVFSNSRGNYSPEFTALTRDFYLKL